MLFCGSIAFIHLLFISISSKKVGFSYFVITSFVTAIICLLVYIFPQFFNKFSSNFLLHSCSCISSQNMIECKYPSSSLPHARQRFVLSFSIHFCCLLTYCQLQIYFSTLRFLGLLVFSRWYFNGLQFIFSMVDAVGNVCLLSVLGDNIQNHVSHILHHIFKL